MRPIVKGSLLFGVIDFNAGGFFLQNCSYIVIVVVINFIHHLVVQFIRKDEIVIQLLLFLLM